MLAQNNYSFDVTKSFIVSFVFLKIHWQLFPIFVDLDQQLNYSDNCIVSLGVWEYIEGTRDMVRDLEKRVQLAKSNVETVNKILSKLCEKPLYQRKDDKKDCLLNLEVSWVII